MNLLIARSTNFHTLSNTKLIKEYVFGLEDRENSRLKSDPLVET